MFGFVVCLAEPAHQTHCTIQANGMLVAHLWACRVCPLRDKREANC